MLYAESKGKAKFATTDSSSSAVSLATMPSAISLHLHCSQLEARKEALRRDVEYGKYVQTLVGAGFFKGELEGSAKWNELEDQAARMWIDVRKKEWVTISRIHYQIYN